MKAAEKKMFTAKARLVAVVMAALCAAGVLLLAGCQKEETPSVTLTVVCTDEMRQSLADANVADAEGFLAAAAQQFAGSYEGVNVTIKVVPVADGWGRSAVTVTETADAVVAAGVPAGTEPVAPDPAVDPAATEGAEGAQGAEGGEGAPEGDAPQGDTVEGDVAAEGDAPVAAASLKTAYADEGDADTAEAPEAAEGEGAAEGDATIVDPDAATVDPDAATEPEPAPAPAPAPAPEPAPAVEPAATVTPDVIFGNYADIVPAIYTGRAVPLDSLITGDMKTYIPDAFLQAGKIPGSGLTYMLPFSLAQKVLIINADLFEACELSGFATQLTDITGAPAGTQLTPEAAARDAMRGASVQVWTPAELIQVMDTLVSTLPKVSAKQFNERIEVWNAATEEARAASIAADVAYENARVAGDEEAMAAAQFDLDAALEAIGPRPEQVDYYPLMMVGAGAEGAEFGAALMRMFGASFFDNEGYVHLETTEGVQAATWLDVMQAKGVFPPNAETLTYDDCLQLFSEGRLAMMMVDTRDVYRFYLDAVEIPEAAPATDETAGQTDDSEAAEGDGEDTATETEPAYSLTRHFSFVALPAWSSEALDALKAISNGELAMEDVAGAPYMLDSASCVIPAEFYGFAVLDNGDELALRIAKEFVSYVLNSEDWLKYAACEGQVPADSIIYDTYAKELLFGSDWKTRSGYVVNVSGNVPGWDRALTAFNEAFGQVATGSKTPVEVTASLAKAVNAYVEPAWRTATIHR